MSDSLKRQHDETRELLQKAVAAPYGCGLDIVKAAGYWDDSAPGGDEGDCDDNALPIWNVDVEVSIGATATLRIEAETAEHARNLAYSEARTLDSFDFDHEEICDIVIGSVTKG